MPEKKEALSGEKSPADEGTAPEIQARPAPRPTKTVVSETRDQDGSYEIIYSDGSGEAGQGGGG